MSESFWSQNSSPGLCQEREFFSRGPELINSLRKQSPWNKRYVLQLVWKSTMLILNYLTIAQISEIWLLH